MLTTAVIKDTSIVIGIVASIIGAGIGYGKHSQAIVETKEKVIEVKKDVKDNQNINIEQTIALEKQAVILEQVATTLEKVEKKLDKQ